MRPRGVNHTDCVPLFVPKKLKYDTRTDQKNSTSLWYVHLIDEPKTKLTEQNKTKTPENDRGHVGRHLREKCAGRKG